MTGIPGEETSDSLTADQRNYYKVEQWDSAGHIVAMVYAGNSLDRARAVFDDQVRRRPAGHYTIRQRARVLREWVGG